MRRVGASQELHRLRDVTGLPEAVATLLTIVVFLVTYWLESYDNENEILFRAVFLAGAILLCAIVVYGVLVRHYVPLVSPVIVAGACMIGLSQLVGFVEVVPAYSEMPVVGKAGWGYLVHLDDMLLYPGFMLMLSGFYMSILHATKMRKRLVEEGREKEEALRSSRQSAEILARRVAFENLATGISSRFINVDQDEIDSEITQSLEAVCKFARVDRAYFVVSRGSLSAENERYEWCSEGVQPLIAQLRAAPLNDFRWSIAVLERGESILVSRPDELPERAASERDWAGRFPIKSLVRVPIVSRGRLRGFIGLDSERVERQWPDETVPLLRIIGEILLSAWDRRCVMRQRALLELQVQQAQKMESLGVMAGGIAHDFNNILTGIMGNAELVQLDMAESDGRRKCLDGILQSSRRAAELCRQMLAYSGRGRFVTESFCLNDLVSEMAPLLRASVPRTASFDCELDPCLPEIQGDRAQFRQILVNLLTNAAESLEDRRGSVTIRTGAKHCSEEFLQSTHLPELLPPGEYAYLEVEDTGSGIAAELHERIFDPFFSTRFAGRGLGLPAVLGIVRSHKGALQSKTAPGNGTLFRLFFPVRETVAKSFFATGEVFGDWHGHGTVVLADDEEMVRSVGAMMLKHLGLDVVTAADGAEAMSRAREHEDRLQCIILDLTMPYMEGDSTCAAFKDQFPDVPIIVASGYIKEHIEDRFTQGYVAAFLQKPFELFNIQPLLRSLLDPVPDR